MVTRITIMVLRLFALLALILGILFWVDILADTWWPLHMLFGLIVVACLWVLGIVCLTNKKGSLGLGSGAIVLGLITLVFGVMQTRILLDSSVHWIVQVVHLVLGLLAIGLGESISARMKRLA